MIEQAMRLSRARTVLLSHKSPKSLIFTIYGRGGYLNKYIYAADASSWLK